MKKILYNIFFILIMCWVGLFSGAFLGSLIIPKSSGIEGPAILFWYSLLGAGLFIIGGVFLIRKLNHRLKNYLLVILLLITVLSVSWFIIQLNTDSSTSSINNNFNTSQNTNFKFASYQIETMQIDLKPLGLGIATVIINNDHPLYFYNNAGIPEDKYPDKIVDSVSFTVSSGQTLIATAPPWLFPEYIKMDYNLLLFRVTTVTRNRIEVIGNSQTLQRYWLNIEDVNLKYWPQFILETNSVEAIDSDKTPVRIKPFDNASTLSSTPNVPLRPLAVKNEWLLVSTNGLADRIQPSGWIRWKRDNKLLVTYSLLE